MTQCGDKGSVAVSEGLVKRLSIDIVPLGADTYSVTASLNIDGVNLASTGGFGSDRAFSWEEVVKLTADLLNSAKVQGIVAELATMEIANDQTQQ